jgi:hypothetical protein
LELELLLQPRRQVDVDVVHLTDLDVDDPALAGLVDEPGDLEVTESHVLGNT